MTLIAREVGQVGFVTYVMDSRRLQVLSRPEGVAWLALHGSVIRWTEPPLDHGSGLDEQVFADLQREVGER